MTGFASLANVRKKFLFGVYKSTKCYFIQIADEFKACTQHLNCKKELGKTKILRWPVSLSRQVKKIIFLFLYANEIVIFISLSHTTGVFLMLIYEKPAQLKRLSLTQDKPWLALLKSVQFSLHRCNLHSHKSISKFVEFNFIWISFASISV